MDETIGKKIMDVPFWYHKIALPNGNVTPGFAPLCAERYAVPDDLTGKRILDIGAWDGYWTWEALKRGAAEVVAIDDFSDVYLYGEKKIERRGWETFDLCREQFGFDARNGATVCVSEKDPSGGLWYNDKGQIVRRSKMDIMDIEELGVFDIVFCFGVIYHLKNPLAAIEKMAAVCDGEIYIETAALDDYSPYKGVVGKGYNHNEMVMEFYPGPQYGKNKNNWWCPTLQCLGAMVESCGFKNIKAWPLTDEPKEVSECRGFVYGTKKDQASSLAARFGEPGEPSAGSEPLKVAAVMSVPRMGFQDNSFCVFQGLTPLNIPLQKTTGAFWGQCLERGIQTQIDTHNADAILTVDYDTVFAPEDVEELIKLMGKYPEIDALVPIQMGRSDMQALMTVKTKTGQVRDIIQRQEFKPELLQIASGHFGLTLLRASSLMKLPHPWFKGEPNREGQWFGGRIDDDIWFWKRMEEHGLKVYAANRVVIGHMELVVKWPNYNLETMYQPVSRYHSEGKPEKVWK